MVREKALAGCRHGRWETLDHVLVDFLLEDLLSCNSLKLLAHGTLFNSHAICWRNVLIGPRGRLEVLIHLSVRQEVLWSAVVRLDVLGHSIIVRRCQDLETVGRGARNQDHLRVLQRCQLLKLSETILFNLVYFFFSKSLLSIVKGALLVIFCASLSRSSLIVLGKAMLGLLLRASGLCTLHWCKWTEGLHGDLPLLVAETLTCAIFLGCLKHVSGSFRSCSLGRHRQNLFALTLIWGVSPTKFSENVEQALTLLVVCPAHLH